MSGTLPFSADQVQFAAGTLADDLSGTMTVLMKTNRYYTDGNLLQAKVSYPVTREWGRMAVEKGWAEDTGAVLPVQDSPGFQEGNVAALQALVSGAANPGGALAMLLPSSGSVAANGALTLTTGVPLSGGYFWGCYMYFPAGAVFAGSVAGMYYVEMSSFNSGTIFNNLYTSGIPVIPATKTPIVAAGPGAYTQTTGAEITLAKITLAGGVLGSNGRIIIQPTFVFPSNANNKTSAVYVNGSVLFGKTRTTATQEMPLIDLRNRGIQTRQFSGWATSGLPATSSSSGVVNLSIDTSADFEITFRALIAVATDFNILESFSLDVRPFI